MAALRKLQRLRACLRRTRPKDGRGEVDRHPCRSALRLELTVAGNCGSLCTKRLEGEICKRPRRCVEQNDEPESLRPRLSLIGRKTVSCKWCSLTTAPFGH